MSADSAATQPSLLRRVGRSLGLLHQEDGEPRQKGRSRYGLVSRRLDEDFDALRARVEELERRRQSGQ